jgi:hypothetical protein
MNKVYEVVIKEVEEDEQRVLVKASSVEDAVENALSLLNFNLLRYKDTTFVKKVRVMICRDYTVCKNFAVELSPGDYIPLCQDCFSEKFSEKQEDELKKIRVSLEDFIIKCDTFIRYFVDFKRQSVERKK